MTKNADFVALLFALTVSCGGRVVGGKGSVPVDSIGSQAVSREGGDAMELQRIRELLPSLSTFSAPADRTKARTELIALPPERVALVASEVLSELNKSQGSAANHLRYPIAELLFSLGQSDDQVGGNTPFLWNCQREQLIALICDEDLAIRGVAVANLGRMAKEDLAPIEDLLCRLVEEDDAHLAGAACDQVGSVGFAGSKWKDSLLRVGLADVEAQTLRWQVKAASDPSGVEHLQEAVRAAALRANWLTSTEVPDWTRLNVFTGIDRRVFVSSWLDVAILGYHFSWQQKLSATVESDAVHLRSEEALYGILRFVLLSSHIDPDQRGKAALTLRLALNEDSRSSLWASRRESLAKELEEPELRSALGLD